MKLEFIKLSVPNILSNLTVPLVSIVDVGLMGRMPTTDYLIAVGLASVIFNFVYWAFGFLRMGTTGLVAQAFGSQDNKLQKELLIRSLGVGIVIGLLLLVCQYFILESSLFLLNVSESTKNLISRYFYIRIYAAPATIGLYAIIGWLLGMQDSKMTLLLAIVINITNVLLSYSFVFNYLLAIEGVALGTIFAQYLGFIVGLLVIKLKYSWVLTEILNSFKILKSNWLIFFKVNFDLFIRTLCLIFVLSFFKAKAAEMDEFVGAANILLLEFVTISAYGIDGLAFAAESITGKYFGSKNKLLLKKAIKIAMVYGLGFGVLISIGFYLFGESILSLLTTNREIIDSALIYLPWLIIAPVINALAFIWDGIYIGCTASRAMKLSIIYSTLFVFLPAYFVFSNFYGNHGIWMSLTLFMLARGLFQTFWAKKYILN